MMPIDNNEVFMDEMRVLIYRYGSICEDDVIDSLKRLGIKVDEERAEIYNKELTPSDGLALMRKWVDKNNYAFIFTINFFPWIAELCQIIKVRYISLIVDSPVLELYSNSIKREYNRVFLFDEELYKEFSPKNPSGFFHLPLCANTERTDKFIAQASPVLRQKYKSQISFVGSTYQEKCPYNRAKLSDYDRGFCNGLIEAQLGVYGYNFIEEHISDEFAARFLDSTPGSYRFPENCDENYRAVVAQLYISVKVAEQERLRALKLLSDNFEVDFYTGSDTSGMPNIRNRGFAKSHEEMPLIFHESKINLNITAKSIRSGISLRVFDVLGCGGFLLTNYQKEIGEYFEIGKDLVTYDSIDSLKEICQYYLAHDDEREEIARHGYETVKKYHTYDVRMLQIIDAAFKN